MIIYNIVISYLKLTIFLGNESLCGANGHGLGQCIVLNSGCMSHGTIGSGTRGLSKGLVMALVVLIKPLTGDQPLNFREAWHALDVGSLSHLHAEILRILNAGATKHFWVSLGLGRSRLGLGFIF